MDCSYSYLVVDKQMESNMESPNSVNMFSNFHSQIELRELFSEITFVLQMQCPTYFIALLSRQRIFIWCLLNLKFSEYIY